MLMEDVVPVVKMFACFDSGRIFYILSVIVQSHMKRSFRDTVFCRAEILISKWLLLQETL